MENDAGQKAELWRINKYLWVCLVYIAGYLIYMHSKGRIPSSPALTFGVLGAAVVNGAARTYAGWRNSGNSGAAAWAFTLVDISALSAGVYLTGGIGSELGIVFPVLLISESLYSTPRHTGILMCCMAVGYIAATWPGHTEPGYWASILTRTFFLLVLGMLARTVSGSRERRNLELARLQEQMAAGEERARIAREIHDGLGHALVASILRLELCSRLVKKDPDEVERMLKEEVPALRAAWNEGRDMAFHLRPWERDGSGFVAALRRHIGRFAERTGIAVDLDADDEPWEIPAGVEMAATRIIQEALTNVAKHAEATEVTVQVDYDRGVLACVIRDNGVGFEPNPGSSSFGIYAMRQRAEQCGGQIDIHSSPGKGTTIELSIPA